MISGAPDRMCAMSLTEHRSVEFVDINAAAVE